MWCLVLSQQFYQHPRGTGAGRSGRSSRKEQDPERRQLSQFNLLEPLLYRKIELVLVLLPVDICPFSYSKAVSTAPSCLVHHAQGTPTADWGKWRAHHPRPLLCMLGFDKHNPKDFARLSVFPTWGFRISFLCVCVRCPSVINVTV